MQGALTIWNIHQDPKIALTANIKNFSAGSEKDPTIGCGVFVSGGGYDKGILNLDYLKTKEIYIDGGIEKGVSDLIAGGLFVVYGANVKKVTSNGVINVLKGVNTFPLDNWGNIDLFVVEKKLTTYDISDVGFINFGKIKDLKIKSPIETFGDGARGFNVYEGSIDNIELHSITTHGNGAVGIAISKEVGSLTVHNNIETFGAVGESLYYGKIIPLKAVPLQLKAGCKVGKIIVHGKLITHGLDIPPIEYLGGSLGMLEIKGGLHAHGTEDQVGTHIKK